MSMFSHIFHSFTKNCIIHELKSVFQNHILLFLIDQYSHEHLILAKHFYNIYIYEPFLKRINDLMSVLNFFYV